MRDELASTPASPALRPELLAPAGDWECVRAAVAAGADAVYFGLPEFNARLRADNFTLADLPGVVAYLHDRGRRAHVTLNTLIFTSELDRALELVEALGQAEVDAVIVQDLGLASLVHRVAPDLELHASTQMTITSPEGARLVRRLGVDQVVLARELSLREIEEFSRQGVEVPLEVFVHGALCVAYSGQCLTSEALGQRSANRGECAQACRQPYRLRVDGELHDLGDRRFLLSPRDLAAVDHLPALVRAGVRTLKIEGRLKAPEYVAGVTRIYREALDRALAETDPRPAGSHERYELEMLFSRGLHSGWLEGDDHQQLVHARFGKKRGPLVGRVRRVHRDHVELVDDPPDFLRPGDGLVFDSGGDTDAEEGGRLFELRGRRLHFGRDHLRLDRVGVGDRVWKTDDPALRRELGKLQRREEPVLTRPLDFEVRGRVGEPLEVRARARDGRSARACSSLTLEPARSRPLDDELLRHQLGKLGGTRFHLGDLRLDLEGAPSLPVREINALRRELVEALGEPPRSAPRAGESAAAVLAEVRDSLSRTATSASPDDCELRVLCRRPEQLEAALEEGIETVLVDFEDIRRYAEAVALTRRQGSARIFLATPRIQKPRERGFFTSIARHEPDGLLLRNPGGLEHFRDSGLRLLGDASLNVSNPVTARVLRDEGLERLTVSLDLDRDQALDLVAGCPPGWLELIAHQHIPMFHMAHCVFAAFLSEGKDHTDCGRPCDHHELSVEDHVGLEHPVLADVGCRNTVFHGRAQSGAFCLEDLRRAGLGSARIELLAEDALATRRTIRAYADLLAGRIALEELLRTLRVQDRLGVTRGPLEVKKDAPRARKPRGARR